MACCDADCNVFGKGDTTGGSDLTPDGDDSAVVERDRAAQTLPPNFYDYSSK